jgi:hypothetical protein
MGGRGSSSIKARGDRRMNPEQPAGKRRFRIKSLLVWIVLIAAGLGWVLHTERAGRALRADAAVFASWIGDFQATHPSVKLIGSSVKSSSSFFEMGRRCDYEFQAPAGRWITIHADLRSGPFHTNRQVTFESGGQEVTWPFEDIERGRKIDPSTEFPGAFR